MLIVLKNSLGVGEIGKDKKGKVKIMINFDDMYQYIAHDCYCIKGFLCQC